MRWCLCPCILIIHWWIYLFCNIGDHPAGWWWRSSRTLFWHKYPGFLLSWDEMSYKTKMNRIFFYLCWVAGYRSGPQHSRHLFTSIAWTRWGRKVILHLASICWGAAAGTVMWRGKAFIENPNFINWLWVNFCFRFKQRGIAGTNASRHAVVQK